MRVHHLTRAALLAAVLALPGRAAAQAPTMLPLDSMPQHRVRVLVPDIQHRPILGIAQGVTPTTLSVLRDDSIGAPAPTLDIPLVLIRRLEVSRGRAARSGIRPIVQGALWGALVGVIAGGVYGGSQESIGVARGALGYGVAGGAAGSLAGLAFGSREGEVWQTVPIPTR